MNISERMKWFWKRMGDGLIYGVVAAVLTILLAFGVAALIGDQTEDETLAQTRALVKESQKNREVLCLGIMHNAGNSSRFEPRLVELCGEIGVRPTP